MQKTELYYQVALSQMEEQEQRNQAIDLKMSGLITLSVTLVGVAAIVLKDFSQNQSIANWSTNPVALVGLALFLFVMTCGAWVLSPRSGWRRDPDLKRFREHLPDYGDEVFVKWAGDQLGNAVEANEPKLNNKFKWLGYAIWALAVQVVCLIVLALGS